MNIHTTQKFGRLLVKKLRFHEWETALLKRCISIGASSKMEPT